jgi:hypothetical protein
MTDIETYMAKGNKEIRLRMAECSVRISPESARVLAQQLIMNAGIAERRLLNDLEVENAQRPN